MLCHLTYQDQHQPPCEVTAKVDIQLTPVVTHQFTGDQTQSDRTRTKSWRNLWVYSAVCEQSVHVLVFNLTFLYFNRNNKWHREKREGVRESEREREILSVSPAAGLWAA